MQIRTLPRKLLTLVLTLALALSLAAPALADDINAAQEQTQTYTYQAPTSPMAVDDTIITATAHRAASPILGMLGLNATAGFGMINGSAPSDLASAEQCAALGVWGSSLNSNPDPYYWNYFYNFYAAENGLALSSDALINDDVAASPVQADTNLQEQYGNISVSLSTRPDIVVGCASTASGTDVNGYDDQLATIHSFTSDSPYYQEGDETYSPELVSYQTTTIKEMIWSVHQLADAVSRVEAATGKTTRYEDVQDIADAYENYVYGIIAYVQEELAAKGLSEKTVACVTTINDDGTYTIGDSISTSATSLLRSYEYAMTVTQNLADVVGSTTVTLDQLLTADVIITINNANIDQTTLTESFGDKSYSGIMITNTPATLYGMTMNSVENAMGYAYVIGCMYSDVLEIDPVELCAYFYQTFLHITDLDGLATVVKTNFAQTVLPAGVSATLSADYSAAKVEAQLAKGEAYYLANPSLFTNEEYTHIGMNEWSIGAASEAAAVNPFTDVAETAYYYEPVLWAVENGITTGKTATTFVPNETCTQAHILTFLWRAQGEPEPTVTDNPFTDAVSETGYYYKAALWAYENGMIDETFEPGTACTRAQAVYFMWMAAGSPEAEEAAFTDVDANAAYAEAVSWALAQGVTTGTGDGTTFSPDTTCTRGNIVAFLYRAQA